MAACGLIVTKTFTYRGSAEEYSNVYWLSKTAPTDAAGWDGLISNLISLEKPVYPSSVSTVRVTCYNDDSEGADSVYTWNAADHLGVGVAGTLSMTGIEACPGDCAAMVRWTTQRRQHGRPVYLRKFFHPAMRATDPSANPDLLATSQKTALETFATAMLTGNGAGWHIVARGHYTEAVPTAVSASSTVRYRQLRRGRKRNPT